MYKNSIVLMFFLLSSFSCSTGFLLKEKITISELLTAKQKIDNTENPAESLLLKNDLSERILVLEGLKVKDIVASTHVDYDFCILSDLQTEKGLIECFIYTKNIRRISRLKKGESIINVKGEFGRFFSMLDSYYTKIEVTNSIIDIHDTPEK